MAAQFHGDALHVRTRERCELLADWNASCEGNLAHDRRLDQMLRHLAWHAPHDVEDARRQSRLLEHPGDGDHGARRVLRALDDDRAAGPDGRSNLANGLVERKVPRCERNAHTDRFAQHELPHVRQTRWYHPAIDSAALLGVPVAVVRATRHLADRFGQRLALIERHVSADGFGPAARELAYLAQDAALLHR